MRVVATLLVRDEEEIVKECIEHHLAHGVDGFIVTDNKSKDRTRQIVEACPGILEIISEPNHNMQQSKWVTRMARHAIAHKADWVVHIDADEFWYGLEILHDPNRLKGAGVLVVRQEYHHVAIAGLEFGKFRRDQMPYYRKIKHPMPKVIHRASASAKITHGNHTVSGVHGRYSGAPKQICIHHYPVRSYGHFEAKTIKGGKALTKHPGSVSNGKRWRGWYKHYKKGELRELYNTKHLYSEAHIAKDVADGKLFIHVPEEYRVNQGSGPVAGCATTGTPETCPGTPQGPPG